MVEAVCIDPKRVHQVWPGVSHLIKSAMDRGGLGDFKVVESEVHSGDALLWLAWDGHEIYAAAVTQIVGINGHRHCTIVACGGHDIERWGFLIGELERFAANESCKSVRIFGRKGWARMLPEYNIHSIVLEKELG